MIQDNDLKMITNYNMKLIVHLKNLRQTITKSVEPADNEAIQMLNVFSSNVPQEQEQQSHTESIPSGSSSPKSIPSDEEAPTKWPIVFIFPADRISPELSEYLGDPSKELKDSHISELIKVLFNKIYGEMKIVYPSHDNYYLAARSLLVQYPHLSLKNEGFLEVIHKKLKIKFANQRRGMSSPTIIRARARFTINKKKPTKVAVSQDI